MLGMFFWYCVELSFLAVLIFSLLNSLPISYVFGTLSYLMHEAHREASGS